MGLEVLLSDIKIDYSKDKLVLYLRDKKHLATVIIDNYEEIHCTDLITKKQKHLVSL